MSGIEQARQNLPLPDLMAKMGFGEFAKSSVRSPFRDEKSPSWGIYESGGRWRFKDHGTGEAGDEIDFIEKVEGLDRKAAIERFCELAGAQKRPQRQDQKPASAKYSLNGSRPLWEKLREAADNDFLSKLAIARGIEFTTMEWARDIGILGNKDGYPAFKNGEGAHHKASDGGWRFFPDKTSCEALVFGDIQSQDAYIFESQWDALAIVDALGIEAAAKKLFVVTRGAGNGKLAGAFSERKSAYIFPQNDGVASNGKIPSEEWFKAVCKACEGATILRVETPKEHKDCNDWVVAGATQKEILHAIESAKDPLLEGVESFSFSDLWSYKAEEDPTVLLGNRWVCQGGQLLLVGQSGIGKSSLTTQAALFWALGQPFFGIKPVRPLRSLIVQAENDGGDMAEIVQGVMSYVVTQSRMGFEQAARMMEENVKFERVTAHVAEDFIKVVNRLLDRFGERDLVFGDPLLSYVGGDISRQDVMSHFLRQLCNPIAFRRKFAWVWSHHTGKPQSDSKARSHWNVSDFAYIGLGSSELTNWARAIAVLQTTKREGIFKLLLAKRGKRANVVDQNGQPETCITLKHADKGLHWEPAEMPEEQDHEPAKRGRKPALTPVQQAELVAFAEAWPENAGGLYTAAAAKFGVSDDTVKNYLKKQAK
jgi:hypothetical protein